MLLNQFMPTDEVIFRIHICQEARCGFLPRVPERVADDVVVRDEFVLEMGGQGGEGGATVGEFGVAACAAGREFVRAEEGVARAAGVEGGVYVEEGVALRTVEVLAAWVGLYGGRRNGRTLLNFALFESGWTSEPSSSRLLTSNSSS